MKEYYPCKTQVCINGLIIHNEYYGAIAMKDITNALVMAGYTLVQNAQGNTLVLCHGSVMDEIRSAISRRCVRGYWADIIPNNPGLQNEFVKSHISDFDSLNETIYITSTNVEGLQEAFDQGVSEWFSYEHYSEVNTPAWRLESPTNAVITFNFGGIRETDRENLRDFSQFMTNALKQYQKGITAPFTNG